MNLNFVKMLKCLNVRMRNSGFTLVEILVVISIIILLSGIILVNYRTGARQFALQRSATKLASDIRRAQEMAVASEECQPCGGGVPAGGYGISIVKWSESYKLYADENNDKHYEFIHESYVEQIYYEKGVELKDIQLLDPNRNLIEISINFTPPDPEINLQGDVGSHTESKEVVITLCLTDTDCSDPKNTKTITVNKAGRIDID